MGEGFLSVLDFVGASGYFSVCPGQWSGLRGERDRDTVIEEEQDVL